MRETVNNSRICAGPESFLEGVQLGVRFFFFFFFFFLVEKGREDPNTIISGTSSASQ